MAHVSLWTQYKAALRLRIRAEVAYIDWKNAKSNAKKSSDGDAKKSSDVEVSSSFSSDSEVVQEATSEAIIDAADVERTSGNDKNDLMEKNHAEADRLFTSLLLGRKEESIDFALLLERDPVNWSTKIYLRIYRMKLLAEEFYIRMF